MTFCEPRIQRSQIIRDVQSVLIAIVDPQLRLTPKRAQFQQAGALLAGKSCG
jgi:hypothetical protein